MKGVRPVSGPELEQYTSGFKAWLGARTGIRSSSLFELISEPAVESRHYCLARFTVLNERRTITTKKSRQTPNYPPEFVITSGDPRTIPLPLPDAFRESVQEYFIADTTRKESCATCEGEGTKNCRECNGHGRIPCSTCGASGMCVQCNGSKLVACRECKNEPTSPCLICNGRGWVKDGYETRKCSKCLNGHVICEECGGRGKTECSLCFGRGTCNECKGIGSNVCFTCNGKKINVCKSCGGEGEWHTYEVMQRVFQSSEIEFQDNPVELPANVALSIAEELKNSPPFFERLVKAGNRPDLTTLKDDIAEFAGESWEFFLSGWKQGAEDVFIRYTLVAVPAARFSFFLRKQPFVGYFVGQMKLLTFDEDPVRRLFENSLDESCGLLATGDSAGAVKSLLTTMEEAATDPEARLKYQKVVIDAIQLSRFRMERSGIILAVVIAIVLPKWQPLSHHLIGALGALLAIAVPIVLSRLIGPNICFCQGKRLGIITAASAAIAASLVSWVVPWGVAIIPIQVVTVTAVASLSYLFIYRTYRKLKRQEENLIALCLREDA